MKKPIVILSTIITLVILSGCFPTGEVRNTASSYDVDTGVSGESADILKEENAIKNFTLDLDLEKTFPSELPVIRLKARDFDAEATKKYFLGDVEIVNTETVPTRPDYISYFAADGSQFTHSSDRGEICYGSSNPYDRTWIEMLQLNYYNLELAGDKFVLLDKPNALNELDGFTKAEAVAVADKIIADLGIRHLGDPTVYSASCEDLKKYVQECREQDGNSEEPPEISKDDEFYFIRYTTQYNNISISRTNKSIYSTVPVHFWSGVTALVGRNGLIEFCTMNIVDEFEILPSVEMKCSPQTAKDNIRTFYSRKLIADPTVINDYSAVYVMYDWDMDKNTYDYTPVWEFSGYVDFIEDLGYHAFMEERRYVDPKTGIVFQTQ